jgi:hypothetical protein
VRTCEGRTRITRRRSATVLVGVGARQVELDSVIVLLLLLLLLVVRLLLLLLLLLQQLVVVAVAAAAAITGQGGGGGGREGFLQCPKGLSHHARTGLVWHTVSLQQQALQQLATSLLQRDSACCKLWYTASLLQQALQ